MDLSDYVAISSVGLLTVSNVYFATQLYCDRVIRTCDRIKEILSPLEKKL